jgi:predicted RNase H-like nuclease (RuvC/YqgF family)
MLKFILRGLKGAMFGKKNSRNDYDYTSLLVRNTELESTISDFKSRLHEVAKERSALSEEVQQLKAELEAYKKNAMPGTAPDTNSNAELAALRKELNWANDHAKNLENALYNERAENAELKDKLNNGGNRMSNEVTQWEYTKVNTEGHFPMDEINRLGKEGWESTGNWVSPNPNGSYREILFKRPKQQKDDDYGYSR